MFPPNAQVEIWRPGYYIVTYIENRGEAEISIDDAVIVSLGCDIVPPQYVLPCGIGVGTSEADLLEAMKSAEVDYKCSDGVYTFLFGKGFSYGRFVKQGIAIYIDSVAGIVKQMEIRESSDELFAEKQRVEADTMHCVSALPSEYYNN